LKLTLHRPNPAHGAANILHGAPDDDVSFNRTASVFRGDFFIHLLK
jgi:hypothetical protein